MSGAEQQHDSHGRSRVPSAPGLVVFCTHGLGDPLVAPLMLEYLLRLQHEGAFGRVLLFTEEPPGAAVPAWAESALAGARIDWVPLRYDVRGRQWSQRAGNLLRMIAGAAGFVRRHGRSWMVGYLSFGGAYAMAASLLGLGRCMVVCFEPHSRYMRDLGIWGLRSMKALLVGWTERQLMRWSDALVVPTTAVRDLVLRHRPRGEVRLQGISIDTAKAAFDADARASIRADLGFADRQVLLYVGKFGGIYHGTDAFMRFIAALADRDQRLAFRIITHPADADAIRRHPLHAALADRMALSGPVPAEELHRHLSAADAGIVAIPPTPSQVFRTPVKTAHYWAAGLPIIIPRGVSDDHHIAEQEDVGVAVEDLVPSEAGPVLAALQRWREEDPHAVRERCMQAAKSHRDAAAMTAVLRGLLISA